MSSSKRLTNTTTELAKQRNQAAAERTLLAWVRSSLTLLGLGLTIDYIAIALLQDLPNAQRVITLQALDPLSLLVMVPGLSLLALAIWQYRLSVRSIRRDDGLLLDPSMVQVTATAVVLFGIISAIIILFRKA